MEGMKTESCLKVPPPSTRAALVWEAGRITNMRLADSFFWFLGEPGGNLQASRMGFFRANQKTWNSWVGKWDNGPLEEDLFRRPGGGWTERDWWERSSWEGSTHLGRAGRKGKWSGLQEGSGDEAGEPLTFRTTSSLGFPDRKVTSKAQGWWLWEPVFAMSWGTVDQNSPFALQLLFIVVEWAALGF